MHTSMNNSGKEEYPERPGQTSQQGSTSGNENYQSQEMNREHSDNVKAGEHAYQQDETQYGKIRESETGMGTETEQRSEQLGDKMNNGIHNAETKVGEWSDKAENKIDEWSDKAQNKMNDMKDKVEDKMDDWSGKTHGERAEDKFEKADKKMDKAEKKMDKAQDKFDKGYENDGMRKMDKAEKKMDKAQDKIGDAHEELSRNTGTYSSSSASGNDNVEDYENRAGKGNPYSNENSGEGTLR